MEIPPKHSPKVSDFLCASLLSDSIPSRQFWVIGSEVEQEVMRLLSEELVTQSLIFGYRGPMFDGIINKKNLEILNQKKPVEQLVDAYETLLNESDQSHLMIFSDWLAENFSLIPVTKKILNRSKFERVIFVELKWFRECAPVFKNENDCYSRKDLYDELLAHLMGTYFEQPVLSAEFCSLRVLRADINAK